MMKKTLKQVKTIQNSGSFFSDGKIYTNKCFYISLKEGLQRYGLQITVEQIMQLFEDNSLSTDIEIVEERIPIQFWRFNQMFPNFQIRIYSDNYDGKKIVDINHCVQIGDGIFIIYILKCSYGHFEYIESFNDLPTTRSSFKPSQHLMDNIQKSEPLSEIDNQIKFLDNQINQLEMKKQKCIKLKKNLEKEKNFQIERNFFHEKEKALEMERKTLLEDLQKNQMKIDDEKLARLLYEQEAQILHDYQLAQILQKNDN